MIKKIIDYNTILSYVKKNMEKPMNIKDVAKLAGVSITTVSRVMNNRPGVVPEVKDRIERIIRETGYRPNLLARELITKKTKTIGIILPAMHNYYSERVDAITEVFKQNGFSVMLANSRNNLTEEIDNFHLLYEKQVNGIILLATSIKEEHIKTIDRISQNIPIIVMDIKYPSETVTSFLHNNYGGAEDIVRHLISLGHKKIAFVSGPADDFASKDRFLAYRNMLNQNSLEIREEYCLPGDYKYETGFKAGMEIAALKDKPTAVFAANDLMAIGVINALHKNKISVPQDISVAGYDDIASAGYFIPSITTIRQHQHQAGEMTAKILLDKIQGKNTDNYETMLSGELIVRESTRKI